MNPNMNPNQKESDAMIVSIQDKDAADFLRNWAARVYDEVQLAQIAVIEAHLVKYATTAWRPMSIDPPVDVVVIGDYHGGAVLVSQNQFGEWRTSAGMPHKPPRAWMPGPVTESR